MVKAAVLTGIRSMEIREFPIPRIKHDDALLKVEMVGVCGSDPGWYTGKEKVNFPLILGHEIVGTIEECGGEFSQLKGVQKGDRVVLEVRFGCGKCYPCVSGKYTQCVHGLGYGHDVTCDKEPFLWGAYSEFLYIPPRGLVHKIDKDVPLEAAVLTCAVMGNAIRWVRTLGGTTIGDTVVILGPGQQGLAGIIAAKEAGASNIIVTGTKNDGTRLEMARLFGADHVITVEDTDPAAFVEEVTNGKLADVVFDATGNVRAIETAINMAKKQGTIVTPGLYGKPALINLDRIVYQEITIKGAKTHDLHSVIPAVKIIESRKYPIEKMVTHKFPLHEAEKAVLTAAREIPGEDPVKVVIEPNN